MCFKKEKVMGNFLFLVFVFSFLGEKWFVKFTFQSIEFAFQNEDGIELPKRPNQSIVEGRTFDKKLKTLVVQIPAFQKLHKFLRILTSEILNFYLFYWMFAPHWLIGSVSSASLTWHTKLINSKWTFWALTLSGR